MRLALFPLVCCALSGSASVLRSDPFARRDSTLLARQLDEVPIPTNLTNPELEMSYASQCAMINTASGQNAIQADIGAATSSSVAIDVRFESL
jgi:hypothetical protein